MTIRAGITNVLVDDQDKAARFHTEALGFAKHVDIPAGSVRWPTSVAPDVGDGLAAVFDDQGGNLTMLFQHHETAQGGADGTAD